MNIDQPHDALFKATFTVFRFAISHVKKVLPPEIVADWDGLRLEHTETHDDALRKRSADLIFMLPVVIDGVRYEHPIFFLDEHQSTDAKAMVWRVLNYIVRFWRKHVEMYPSRLLPAVYPLVLYHGAQPWSSATRLSELVKIPELLHGVMSARTPDFEFQLVDLSGVEPAALPADGFARRSLQLLADHARPDFLDRALNDSSGWDELDIEDGGEDVQLFQQAIAYILSQSDEDRHVVIERATREIVPVLGPRAESEIMTAAQQLIEEGRQEGIDIGEHRRDVKLVARALERGMEESEIADFLGTSIEDVRKLAEEAKKQAPSD